MTREQLKEANSEGAALAVYHEVQSSGDFVGFVHQYMYDVDYRVARNAMWSLTKATDAELSQLQPILSELIDFVLKVENSSVRRLTMNVIVRLDMQEDDLRTDFLDFCMERMISINEFPGIQSLAMKLAHRMCSFYPELHDELIRTLRGMETSYYKPAVLCVRRKILSSK